MEEGYAHEEELSARASLSHEAAELRAANEKERSARTSLSNEAAELRGEIAILRGFLADQAADQVYLPPAAYFNGGARAALFARKPSSPCSTAATPVKALGELEPGWPTTHHTSPSPPQPPPSWDMASAGVALRAKVQNSNANFLNICRLLC